MNKEGIGNAVSDFANNALLFALIFISVSILISLWLGYLWRKN